MKFVSLRFQQEGSVGILTLNRPAKRNALSDAMVEEIDRCFAALPSKVKALVLDGAGEHFCAGLDLSELADRSAAEGVAHSRGKIAPHSTTSSALASRAGGIARPSAFAVLRLIASSYLVGSCTGRSGGFSPFRMRST